MKTSARVSRDRPPPHPVPLAIALRAVMYVMLLGTAAVTVVLGETLWTAFRDGFLPRWAPMVAPGLFTLFVVVYTLDRWFLVRHRGYSQSRALMQVAFGLVFLTLLLQPQAQEMRLPRPPVRQDAAAMILLGHADETVRAAACDVLTGQLPAEVFDTIFTLSRQDASVHVRESCRRALGRTHTVTGGGR